ncbi:MAG: endolytic transglycosylase MltG [Actinomycetota bacterium]|nr:endolytic transglycosylase MltG [Actinomycetota bacterium]
MSERRRGRALVILFVLFVLFAAPAMGGYLYLRSVGFFGESEPGPPVTFKIPRGAGTETIGRLLEENGVIASAFGFRLATYFEDGIEDIQSGRYEIPTGLTPRDALNALIESGPLGAEFVTVTFPEGSWLTDFANTLGDKTHLSEQRFLSIVENGKVPSQYKPEDIDTLEGLLFPSTYQVVEKDTEISIATRLVEQMEKQMEKLDFATKAEALGLTPYEGLIVASMIEGEASVGGDRDKIARVIYNRLDQGIALGIDATIIYALGEHRTELFESDLEIDSPYNTRLVQGLPPTPIGAPGEESLHAAVNPADGEWLYYVLSDCEGHHAFSVDYNDFLNDKRAYQALDC